MVILDEGSSGATTTAESSADLAASGGLNGFECFWCWVLRLVLPVLVCLSGLLIYWVCIENIYGISGIAIVSNGAMLTLITITLSLWATSAWICKEPF